MSASPIAKGKDNCYHPKKENEIIDLVKYAKNNGYQVRVRGSCHSMPQAIFTDEVRPEEKLDVLAIAPDGNNVNIMLDLYTAITSSQEKIVTVEAGIHLGHDPMDPLSTPDNSLLYQLHHKYGLALDDLGGITHQTVGGFLMTGSSGGSVVYSIGDNVQGLRFIDGNGEIFTVSKLDKDPSNFHAALTSLGLLGVLSQVTFECSKKFNISGHQLSTPTPSASVDIFSADPHIGLINFLKKTDYTRILWWPQTFSDGHGRVQVWKAERTPDLKSRNPYSEFSSPKMMMLYSNLLTITGSNDSEVAVQHFDDGTQARFKALTISELIKLGKSKDEAESDAENDTKINNFIADLIAYITKVLDPIGSEAFRNFLTVASISLFNVIDGPSVPFSDYAYLALPMDSTADDILVPIMFTEIWVPLSHAADVTTAIKHYFNEKPEGKISRTGNNAWELYAAKPSKAWLSMSYSDGTDVWKDGAFRVDAFWFLHNSGDFRKLYRPIWLLLKNQGIPYRLHWGKSFPVMHDQEITADFLVTKQYPMLSNFLALREKKDPNKIFVNSYWKHWLGI